MSFLKRLRLLTGVLGAAAVTTVVGSSVFGDLRGPGPGGGAVPPDPVRPDGSRMADDLARTKFSDQPALTYTSRAGDRLFAWQVKPTLPAGPAAPRDLVVVVDTSASQAGASLDRSRQVISALLKDVSADDRVDIWTVNIDNPAATRSLTNGLKPGTDAALQTAVATLADAEYGAGAVDLPAALQRIAAQFPNKAGRTQAILYLGDGESAASATPMTEARRIELGTGWPTARSPSSRSRSGRN